MTESEHDEEAPPAPVFLDQSGRRWRRMRRGLTALGVGTTLLLLGFVASVLVPPLLPTFKPVTSGSVTPKFEGSRRARLRRVKKEQLVAALEAQNAARSIRSAAIALGRTLSGKPGSATKPIRAGFYVSWADNSLASFRENAGDMDWVICEWGFLSPKGDTVLVRPDTAFFGVYDSIPVRPKVLLQVNNFDRTKQRFNGDAVRFMLRDSASRARVQQQILDAILRYKLAGVAIDFEGVPTDAQAGLVEFDAELKRALSPRGLLTTHALLVTTDDKWLRRFADANDYVYLMLYDEHYGGGTPGPVASQSWYFNQARRLLRTVPKEKAILTIGGYGYDWNDGDHSGDAYTFQEVLAKGRDNASSKMTFDKVSLNPYMRWTDPDSTDHVLWYLDAATGYNQMRVGHALGAAGFAMWRLGDEDPSFWKAIQADNVVDAAAAMNEVPPGYITEFEGDSGEILQVVASPHAGRRVISYDTTTGQITGERIDAYPSSYIVRKTGQAAHQVAITFDDGPDGTWTPQILDTLRSRGVSATFFVIGRNVEAHIPLMRRIVKEGHLVGNHTFTHPNLALTSNFMTKLELDANQRLLEAILNRRSLFFRPPYFGDAEPTTNDELVPVEIASKRGYVTVGLHIDAEDWQPISAHQIIANVLDQRYYGGQLTGRTGGNVVLLHDGGGNRSQTVKALGLVIDSLRAHGDTIVSLAELAGITKDEAMPPLPRTSAFARSVELTTFSVASAFEWTVYWLFLIAVVVGGIRLAIIILLGAYQRFRPRRKYPHYTPPVTVIVPAYNEAKVINSTIRSLLSQRYEGPLDIVIVDDGSPDETYDVVQREFGANERVRIFRKANGGKASALNFGIARANGEIIVCLDADTQFTPTTVAHLVAPMHDMRVGAVAGNAKVGNRTNIVTRWQALEYVTSQNLDRRAFAVLNAITIVPGAVGAWRRSYVQAVGGFSDDTLAEDQDLTWALGEEGVRVVYADDAIAYTEAPDSMSALIRQRFRWAFGTLQCAWKHKRIFMRPKYGMLGMVAMPNVWVFQIFYTAISPLADLLFAWSLLSVLLTWYQHGATYALLNLEEVLFLYSIFLIVDWAAAVIAFLMEPGEEKSLTWLILIQRFVYRQAMYLVVIRSIAAAFRGHVVGWGKLERKGMGLLPTTAPEGK